MISWSRWLGKPGEGQRTQSGRQRSGPILAASTILKEVEPAHPYGGWGFGVEESG